MGKAGRNQKRIEDRPSMIDGPLLARFGLHVFATALMVLVSSGCNTVNKKSQGDPLLGNVKPQSGLTGAANISVPPLPGPTTTASTAALASVNPRPLDGSHDLRIPDSGQNFGPSGTQLQQPVMGTRPNSGFAPVSRQGQPATPAATSNPSNLSYEEAQARLNTRGVAWQRLESWGDQGDWKFTCSIPNKQNPYISRTYEAEAHDPLSAVHGVLDQIERDQR
jgi:hypothetical protein